MHNIARLTDLETHVAAVRREIASLEGQLEDLLEQIRRLIDEDA
jgi:hypothetical protein